MAQPVYVVPRPSDEADMLGGLYTLPFLLGWLYLSGMIWDDLTIHAVLRLLLIVAALMVALLAFLRPARVLYALAVPVVGSVLLFRNAPDTVWAIFGEIILLAVWCFLAISFELRQEGERMEGERAAKSVHAETVN